MILVDGTLLGHCLMHCSCCDVFAQDTSDMTEEELAAHKELVRIAGEEKAQADLEHKLAIEVSRNAPPCDCSVVPLV